MEIKIFDKPAKEGIEVRKKVFIEEQGFPYDLDDIDDRAYHISLIENGETLGVCRVFEGNEKGVYTFGRLAVLKEHRGKGFGAVLVRNAVELIKSVKGKKLLIHSQLHAKEFYEKQGFEVFGNPDTEEGRPHVWLKMEL